MVTRSGSKRGGTTWGFTLIELLLSVALLLLLVGAVVYNFSPLQRGADLEEGATQFEALLRFARAHAANTGRPVQITFQDDLDDTLGVSSESIRALWEPDPLGQPGTFETLPEASGYLRSILDLVTVAEVRPLAGDGTELVPLDRADDSPATPFVPVNFYPDGSSDSAEIVLASRGSEDGRLLAVRLLGVVGSVRRRQVSLEKAGEDPAPSLEPPAQPAAKPE